MYKYLLVFLLLCVACNAVKRVLRDPAKTLQVVDEYNRNLGKIEPPPPVIKQGKPDTTEKQTVDTTSKRKIDTVYYKGDTVKMVVTIRDTIVQTKTKYVNRTDTLSRQDPALIAQLQSFQRQAAAQGAAKDQYKKDADDYKAKMTKWKMYFWLLFAGIVVGIGLTIFIKSKNKINV